MTVRRYVQDCFDMRDVKCVAVAKLETPEDIQAWLDTHLNTGWPSQVISVGV